MSPWQLSAADIEKPGRQEGRWSRILRYRQENSGNEGSKLDTGVVKYQWQKGEGQQLTEQMLWSKSERWLGGDEGSRERGTDGNLGGDTFWILTTSGVQTWERGRK